MKVGSLFTGIGGIDLGLERAGMSIGWHAEVDSYCCRVLRKHWPDVPNLGDVRTINWENVPHVDVIAGGYPCQPFSLAGARGGTDDPRHLWPVMANAIRQLRPRFALLENVAGHLSMGFGDVLGELAEIGYDAEWDCVPAAAVGAPHRRDRVFVIAYPNRHGEPTSAQHGKTSGDVATDPDGGGLRGKPQQAGSAGTSEPEPNGAHRNVSDPDGAGLTEAVSGRPRTARAIADHNGGFRSVANPAREHGNRRGKRWPVPRPETFERTTGRGSSDWAGWAVEPDVGRVAYGVPHRVDRLRALGNAVVPQVAEHLGRIIMGMAT